MTEALRQACVGYGNPSTWVYGGCGPEQSDTDTEQVERYDNVASNGARVSYYVGERRFIERTFRFQSTANLDLWRAFFRADGGRGEPFWYYDNAPPICGLAGNAGTGTCGGDSVGVLVTLEPTEFRPQAEDVWGYWAVTLTMRRTV